jgi:Bacterial PH domain
MQRFAAAPWPLSLKVVSAVAAVVLIGATFAVERAVPRGTRVPFAETFGSLLVVVPAAILFVALLFVVRGYEVATDGLYVERLLWRTRVGLDGLRRAWHDPAVMRRSIRLFGNGGLFAVTGIYQNRTIGRYRAFVTNPKLAVVLQFESRTVVVSPAHVDALLGELRLVAPGVAVGPPPGAV